MKVIFDNIIFSLQRAGGISGMWAALVSRLMDAPGVEPWFIERPSAAANIFRRALSIPASRILPDSRFPTAASRWLPPRVPFPDGPFIFHSSYYRTAPESSGAINVTTLHDFTYERLRLGSTLARALHSRQKLAALRRSAATACVSAATAADLRRFAPGIGGRVEVICNAPLCTPAASPAPGGNLPPEARPAAPLLFVGSREPYKRFYLAVAAAAMLHRPLIVAGAPLSVSERAMVRRSGAVLESVIHPSADHLSALYSRAGALLYLSEAEGFGIPVVEAQAHGCPVVTVAAPWLFYVAAPESVAFAVEARPYTVAAAVRRLDDPDFALSRITAGYKNAARYSWQRAAGQYLSLYSSLIAR